MHWILGFYATLRDIEFPIARTTANIAVGAFAAHAIMLRSRLQLTTDELRASLTRVPRRADVPTRIAALQRENIEGSERVHAAQRVLTPASFARQGRQQKLHTELAAANGCRRPMCSRRACAAQPEALYYRADKTDPRSTVGCDIC